jgi:hypothetical protein
MAASDHLHPKLFMTAKELMDTTPGYDNEDWSKPIGSGTIDPEFQDFGHLTETHTMTKVADIKRAENNAPHDEGMFGTDKNTDEGESLMDSIKRQGIVNPVKLRFSSRDKTFVLTDGQHRTVAANDIDPNMYVPLEYDFGSDAGMFKYPDDK